MVTKIWLGPVCPYSAPPANLSFVLSLSATYVSPIDAWLVRFNALHLRILTSREYALPAAVFTSFQMPSPSARLMNTEFELLEDTTIVPFNPPRGVHVTKGLPRSCAPVSTVIDRVFSFANCSGDEAIL